MIYKTKGTCSTSIDVELKDGVIDSVKFTGGCNGNLQGISALVKGMKPEEAISRLKGIRCGILDDSYLPCAVKAIRGILDRIDSDGTVLEVSGGTGMGMDAEHYKNILIAPMAYGQSLTILALAEALNV